MASEVFQLAILLSLKDGASGGLGRFEAQLRAAGKEGEKFHSEFERIRRDLNRDLAIGGVGVAGMSLLGKGVQVAADYQQSMTDLRTSFTQVSKDGKTNFDALGKDMTQAGVVAMKLGNALPGTTEDFIQMMQVMKQNGMETQTILNGAADAVANLAVTSHAIPKEIAGDFAQFGNLFNIKSRGDWDRVADSFGRINTSTGQTSAELIEAAKYFQGRAGQGLGLTGAKDAEQITRLFGLLGKQGLRGSMAGTELTDFFGEYMRHKDKVKELQESTGIKLKFFDDKGTFVGMDDMFRQLAQFRKLSNEQQVEWGNKIFGFRGGAMANQFAKTGVEGWREFNATLDQTISTSAKAEEISKNFNNQLEALTGTAKNLVVAGFEPMLPPLTKTLTTANAVVGSLTDFAKANPGLMQTLGTLTLYGTTAMALYGGVKTLTTGFQLLKIAMAFSRGESALTFFNQTAAASETATRNVAGFTSQAVAAEKKVGALRQGLGTLANSSAVKIGVQIGAIMLTEAAVSGLVEHIQDVMARAEKTAADRKALGQAVDTALISGDSYKAPGTKTSNISAIAKPFFESIDESGMLARHMHPEKLGAKDFFWYLTEGQPYGNSKFGSSRKWAGDVTEFGDKMAAHRWERMGLGQVARDPNNLAEIIRQLPTFAADKGLNQRDIEMLTAAIENLAKDEGGPERWQAVLDILAKDKGENKPAVPTMFQPGVVANPFGSISGIRTPLNIQPFNPFQPSPQVASVFRPTPTINLFDGSKQQSKQSATPQLFTSLKPFDLTPPKADKKSLFSPASAGSTPDMFKVLNQPITDTARLFGDLTRPTTDTGTAFGNLVDPAGRLPGKFNNIGVTADSLTIALFNASEKMNAWTPPQGGSTTTGPDGKPLPLVTAKPYATGGFMTGSGLAYVHAKEEIVPAQAVSFRDTLSTKMISTLVMLKERTQRSDLPQMPVVANTTINSFADHRSINNDVLQAAVNSFAGDVTMLARVTQNRPEAPGLMPWPAGQRDAGQANFPFTPGTSRTATNTFANRTNSIVGLPDESPDPQRSPIDLSEILARSLKGGARRDGNNGDTSFTINMPAITINAGGRGADPAMIAEVENEVKLSSSQLQRRLDRKFGKMIDNGRVRA